jgi:hypothetical protein
MAWANYTWLIGKHLGALYEKAAALAAGHQQMRKVSPTTGASARGSLAATCPFESYGHV